MNWFQVLKMIPVDKLQLGIVIGSNERTENTVRELKELRKKPTAVKELLRSVENKQVDLQELKNLFPTELTIEEMEKNFQKIKSATGFMNDDDIRELLREGLKAKNEQNEQRVSEILQTLDENADLSEATLKRKRQFRDILDILREKSGQSSITFENPPQDEKLIADFAKALGGEVKEGAILVNLKSESELVALMSIKKDRKTGKVLDSPANVTKKKAVKESYNKIMRNEDGSRTNTKMIFNSGAESVEVDDIVRQKKIFVASEEKFTVREPFTGQEVLKYIRAVDKVKGSVRAFRPRKLPNGASFPLVVLMDKSSSNSMNLNPYAELILTNTFPDNWAKPFFDSLRVTQMLSKKEAESIIIDEIYNAIMNNERQTESKLSVTAFLGEGGIEDPQTKTKKRVKEEIRKLIGDSARLSDSIQEAGITLREDQAAYLGDNFTVKEASDFEKFYETLDREEYPLEDLEIKYMRNGRSTEYTTKKIDEEGNEVRDAQGSVIYVENDGKTLANYAEVYIEGDKITPKEAYDFGLKVTSKTGDIQQDIDKLRSELLGMDDFPSYLIMMAKKLKESGGLNALVSKIERSATALQSITPERSLGFFAQVDDLAGEGKVKEAFKTIDANPDSDDAKKAAESLNKEMPQIIKNIRTQIVGGFKLRLEDFANNPASFPDNQVISAKKQFVDKEALLIQGE